MPSLAKKILIKIFLLILGTKRNDWQPRQLFRSAMVSKTTRNFYKKHLNFSDEISNLIRMRAPRKDKYITIRKPDLEFQKDTNGRELVSIDTNYLPENEVRIDKKPYEALADCLLKVCVDLKVESILDIGCSSGPLIESLHKRADGIQVAGIENFQFLRDAASPSIRNSIYLADLRFPIRNIDRRFDLGVCLEVGEHVDPIALDQFLENISELVSHKLVMSWSDSYPDKHAPAQHISPLPYKKFVKLVEHFGFERNETETQALRDFSKTFPDFHYWWTKSITVFERTST